MTTLGDFWQKSTAKHVDIITSEIALFKNLIKERAQPFDLVRELLSNAGASQVGATKIAISYIKDREGHVFEIEDDGCGMNFTGQRDIPGRLDKFLGLGLSSIVGIEADEFSWKGLGSKLSYQSRRVEIQTRFKNHPLYHVTVNEPWSSLERNLVPKPRITEFPNPDEAPFTRIRVVGHPPHRLEQPFTLEEIRTFLLHRTFAGFTRPRDDAPEITLSVLGHTEVIPFGFPGFRDITWPKGIELRRDENRLLVNIIDRSPVVGLVCLKGFLTWDAARYGLSRHSLNTGLILSSRGIPYFELSLEDCGARSITHANPGAEKTCLVVECDGIYSEMNISRSNLVDSAGALAFKKVVTNLLRKVERSDDYLAFRQIPRSRRIVESAESLSQQKREIELEGQNWVVFQRHGRSPLVLIREPKNENEVNALLWKLEALDALPFAEFQTLAYVGTRRGPDIIANFQEDQSSEPLRAAVIEVENNFYSYRSHGHLPSQYPKVICWDTPTSGRKVRLRPVANKKYKYTVDMGEYQVHVFVLSRMEGIKVVSRRELSTLGLSL